MGEKLKKCLQEGNAYKEPVELAKAGALTFSASFSFCVLTLSFLVLRWPTAGRLEASCAGPSCSQVCCSGRCSDRDCLARASPEGSACQHRLQPIV